MKMPNNLFGIVLCLLLMTVFAACSGKEKQRIAGKDVMMETMTLSQEVPPPVPGNKTLEKAENSKLVKTGTIGISSNDIEASKILIYRILTQCKGTVTSENLTKEYGVSIYELSVFVPVDQFDRFFQLIDSSKINISDKKFSVEDVTLRFIDDSIRLENKKKLEQKYLGLLAKTNEMKSILEIEDKLEEIRSDIEVKQGQLNALTRKIAYSSVEIKIIEAKSFTSWDEQNRFSYQLKEALSSGWNGLKNFSVFLVAIWPAYFIFGFIIWFFRWYRKKRRVRKS